ncbi:MAG: exodeoxyribonuclease V subunit gamma [Balneolaceae bacterium]
MKLYKSNTLEKLADKLAGRLTHALPADPLTARQIIVPNKETAGWLKLKLAEELGVAANLSFLLPSEWQFRMIRKLYPALPALLPSDPGPLSWLVFDVLSKQEIRERFARLDTYVNSQKEPMQEKALRQLSLKIASVFDQYLVYRPSMILKWQQGDAADNGDERWQADLWNLIEDYRKKSDGETASYPNRAELVAEATQALRNGSIKLREPVYLFNPHLQPESLFDMTDAISNQVDCIVFQCVVNNMPRDRNHHPLLDAFGDEVEGTERQLEPYIKKVESDIEQPDNTSLLGRVQHSILTAKPFAISGQKLSESVQIHSCHSPLREVEVLYQFLLRQFEKNPDLHPDDILVAMPDPEQYAPVIHAVFGAGEEELPSIPYHVDFRQSDQSALKAFEQLLHLADSRFYTEEVLDLLMNPSVRESFQITKQSTGRLNNWIDENSVVWGLDERHRLLEKQPPEPLKTWQAVVGRGWNGQIFGRDDSPFDHPEELRFHEIEGREQQDTWAGFNRLLAGLRWLNGLSKEARSLGDWCNEMETMLSYFISDESSGENGLSQVYSILQSVRDEAECASITSPVSFGLFRTQAESLLVQQTSASALFTRGITFSSMVPVRSIPAKIIALVGLNEGEFPRKPGKIDFDLMAANPRITERNPKHQDRSLFLESIMAAKNIHYCSYVGQSRKDNEEIPPSPVVSEWVEFLSSISEKGREEWVIKESLHGFSQENFTGDRSLSQQNYKIAEAIRHGRGKNKGFYLPSGEMDIELPDAIELENLMRFISNPQKEFIRYHFGASLTNLGEEKNEFLLNALEVHLLFERLLEWRISGIEIESIETILAQSGRFPSGWRGISNQKDLQTGVESALQEITNVSSPPGKVRKSLDTLVHSFKITGELISYSKDRFFTVTPSGTRGDKLLRGWIEHLFAQFSGLFTNEKSFMLSNLKKDPELRVFNPVDEPEEELGKVLHLYLNGMKKPPLFFPNTNYEFVAANRKKEGTGYGKAKSTFEGSTYRPHADNRDAYAELFLGRDAQFSEAYLNEVLGDVILTMQNHTEEKK